MNVVIIGAGGHGRVVLDIFRAEGRHKIVGFLDADAALVGSLIDDVEVLGPVNMLTRLKSRRVTGVCIAIGDNRVRQQYATEVRSAGLEIISAIHPSAVVASGSKLEAGVVVCAQAVVCVQARIGEASIVNTGAIVDHECVLAAAVHICPGAILAGRVRVGARAFIGLGARVIQCLEIGDDAMIAAGAVVVRSVATGTRVAGVPARPMRH